MFSAAGIPCLQAGEDVNNTNENPEVGDYVLATKFSDGDPGDAWALGLYAGQMLEYTPPRHDVVNSEGKSIRHNGFRRVARVRKDVGAWLLNVAAKQLEKSPPGTVNLWTMLTPAAFDVRPEPPNAYALREAQLRRQTWKNTRHSK